MTFGASVSFGESYGNLHELMEHEQVRSANCRQSRLSRRCSETQKHVYFRLWKGTGLRADSLNRFKGTGIPSTTKNIFDYFLTRAWY